MAETITIDRSSVAKCLSTSIQTPATVSASALALHLDCGRTYIGKLEGRAVTACGLLRPQTSGPLPVRRGAHISCRASPGSSSIPRRRVAGIYTPFVLRQGRDRLPVGIIQI